MLYADASKVGAVGSSFQRSSENKIFQTTNLPKVDYLSIVLLSILIQPKKKEKQSHPFVSFCQCFTQKIHNCMGQISAIAEFKYDICTINERTSFQVQVSFYIYSSTFLANVAFHRNKQWMTQIFTVQSNHQLETKAVWWRCIVVNVRIWCK